MAKVRLGDYVRIRTGKLDANAADQNGKYPFFTCSIVPLCINTYSYDCECVLVAGNGDLNVKYYNGKFDAYQRTYIVESLNNKLLTVPYLYRFMEKYIETLRNISIGGVIKYIKLGNLTEANINLPTVSKQNEIVDVISNVDNLIKEAEQQLADLDILVKSRFIEMFGDPIRNDKFWPINKLKDVTIKIGSGATPKGGKESYPNEGIYFIRSLNVHDGLFEFKDLAHLTENQAKLLNNVIVEQGDVLLNITGASVARTCVVPNEILPARVNQHVSIIRCNKNFLNSTFMNRQFLSDSFKRILLNMGEAGGATRQAITKQQLEDTTVIVPPITLQKEYASFVMQVDKSKLAIQQSLDELEILKKSLMQQYFG